MAADFKKISVVQTNNEPAFISDGKWIADYNDFSYLKILKEYILQAGYRPAELSELSEVINALKWVNEQWDHDGLNQPPSDFKALDILKSVHKDKQKYRCVEFGIVLSELLQAFGFITRTVALRSNEVAYGGFGQGHVAMEVWINELSKWIFLDPQFGAYLTDKDSKIPLNFFELYQQKKNGNWDKLKVYSVSGKNDVKQESEYKKFLKHYFGHLRVSAGKNQPNICLLLEAQELPLTFQGMASSNQVFTKDVSIVYPELNKVTLLLSYREDVKDTQSLMKELNIKSEQDYLNGMAKFAAKPNFIVKIKSSMPQAKGYEYRNSKTDKWSFIKDPEFTWDATEADNILEVRGVNEFGRPGPITYIKTKYQ